MKIMKWLVVVLAGAIGFGRVERELFAESAGSWQELLDQSRQMLQAGHAVEAVAIARKALQEAERRGPADAALTPCLVGLGIILCSQDPASAEAARCFERAVAVQEGVTHPESESLIVPLTNLGMLLLKQKQLDRGCQVYDRLLKISKKHFGESDPRLGNMLQDCGTEEMDAGALEAASRHFQEALDLQLKASPSNPRALVDALAHLREVSSRLEDAGRAGPAIDKALALAERQPAFPEVEKGRILTHLAGVQFDRGELDAAEANYDKALPMLTKNGADLGEILSLLNNMGLVLIRQKDYVGASTWLEEADRLELKHPNFPPVLRTLTLKHLQVVRANLPTSSPAH